MHQPLLLDGTLDQLQQLRIRPMASVLHRAVDVCSTILNARRCGMSSATVAQELNAETIEQVVYARVMRLPSQPLPIIGSGKIERVRSALGAEEAADDPPAVVPYPQSRAGL